MRGLKLNPLLCFDLVATAVVISCCAYLALLDFGGVNPDAAPYLEMARAMVAQDWDTAANATWSPGLPLLLAFAFAFMDVSVHDEPLVATAIGLLACLAVLASSIYFCRKVDPLLKKQNPWAALSLRMAVYATVATCLSYISPVRVTSDLELLAITIILAACLVDFSRKGEFRFRDAGRLGLLGGLGFLFKQSYLPVALLILVLCLHLAKRLQWPKLILSFLLGYCLVIAPWTVALSIHRGRFTMGDNGRWNYVEYVNGIDHYFWRSVPERFGRPLHPPTLVDSRTETYLYRGRLQAVSMPLHYDLAWWADGEVSRFDLASLYRQFLINLNLLADFLRHKGVMVILLGTAWLVFAARKHSSSLYRAIAAVAFWLPVAAYMLVHAESRHIVPFLCVSFCLASSAATPMLSRRQLAFQFLLGAAVAVSGAYDAYRSRQAPKDARVTEVAARIDAELRSHGVPAHADVVVVSTVPKLDHSLYVLPRFARFRLAGLVLNEAEFRTLSEADRNAYYERLRLEGVRAIVAKRQSITEETALLFSNSSNHVLIQFL